MDEALTENLNFTTSPMPENCFGQAYCLVVMTGPGKGGVHKLPLGPSTLGRSERTDFPVYGKGISRVHATIFVQDDGTICLQDNGSTNGVYKSGSRIADVELYPGDVFGLGPELKIRVESTEGGLHELIDEMYRSSKTDLLTGLLNRRAFEERLDEEFSVVRRHGLSSCLAILDIDHFKAINDTWGHDAGDQVLRRLAALLQEEVRTGDLVGRWGGEEFLIYVRQSDLAGATILLNRLREMVSQLQVVIPGQTTLSITFSGGLVALQGATEWRISLAQADEALYLSKEAGRNRVTVV